MQVNYDTCKSTQQDEASYDNEVKTKIIPEGRGRGETRAMKAQGKTTGMQLCCMPNPLAK